MRGSDGVRVILDRRGGEDLAPARRVEHVHFIGRAGQSADLASAPEVPERSKGGDPPAVRPFLPVLWCLGIDEIHGNGLDTKFLDIGEAGDGASGVVVVCGAGIARSRSVDELVECREDLGGLGGGHIQEATPDFGGGEAACREAGDDAEVVGATFESAPEVRVG